MKAFITPALLLLSAGLCAARAQTVAVAAYTGHDGNGVPHYATRSFTPEERTLLRTVYGVEDPSRLYLSDSSGEAQLKYDTRRKSCWSCYVNSYRLGFTSVRRSGESWEQLEQRVATMSRNEFPPSARVETTSIDDLDPAIRDDVRRMLGDAVRAGFSLRIAATYRSPMREAYLMKIGHGRTHTLTSLHSYGRAIDLVVGDGNPRHTRTRSHWIAFRRWVTAYHAGEFRILGGPDRTWDWPHVEVPSAQIGFRSIDAALRRARACAAGARAEPCDFAPPSWNGTR